ncbi:MAG TPA: hypothetical protein VFC82_11355 [Actinomycetaceae bacterium]|nr:hypothetical protein [Actinomycetaceae bacterium]
MVRRNEQMVSDSKVRAATGEGRDHWFGLLDSRNATEWSHKEMAAFLVEQGVDEWWAQGITVAYEQARGLRSPGQRSDGTFDASASKTLPISLEELWPFLTDEDRRSGWLGPDFVMTGETPGKSVRLARGEHHRVVLNFYGPAPVGTPSGKTRVQAQISNLPDSEAAAAAKDEWKAALGRLAEKIAG